MYKLFSAVLQHLERGERVMLVSVISGRGSVPRSSGAKMAVFADGGMVGTIGGGAMENTARLWAVETLGSPDSTIARFDLDGTNAADASMLCGGSLEVCFQPLDGTNADDLALVKSVLAACAAPADSWLITRIADSRAQTRLYSSGDAPYRSDWDRIYDHLGRTAYFIPGDVGYYIEPLARRETVYIFGGGHVARETAALLAHLDFRVAVYEDRAEFLTHERFPDAYDLICGDFGAIAQTLPAPITADDYVVIMTRGHLCDFDVLSQALRTPAHYVGMIGSSRKRAAVYARLYQNGFTESDTARVHSPIGLDILAQTPAEIAVSVAAELVRARAEAR